jgi:hypothetical protein
LARVQKSACAAAGAAAGDGLAELAGLAAPCSPAAFAGLGDAVVEGDASGLAAAFADPTDEFELPEFDPAEFALAPLLDPFAELVFPDLDLLFEFADEFALSRADEFLFAFWFPRLFALESNVSLDGRIRLFEFEFADRTPLVFDHWKLRGRLNEPGVLLPATAMTTSSRLPFCCT